MEEIFEVGSFSSEVLLLLWVEPELLLFCLDFKELLLDLESDLLGSDFCLDLLGCWEWGFHGRLMHNVPNNGNGEGVWLGVNHIILNTFHETVASLSSECCVTPLNTCG